MALRHPTHEDLLVRQARLAAWIEHTPKNDPQRAIGLWRLQGLQAELRAQGGRLDNPAWLDESLTVSWEHLEPRIPPIVTLLKHGRLHAKPYGCGEWGCVLPTVQPGTVLKITNDPSEARLVASILRDEALQLPGVVRYYDIVKLPVRYEHRAVYAIWREEAYDVGDVVSDYLAEGGAPRNRNESEIDLFGDRLINFQRFAERFMETHKRQRNKWAVLDEAHELSVDAAELAWIDPETGVVLFKQVRGYPALHLSVLLQVCRLYAELIAHGPRGALVGRALADFMHEGILLADVHLGNIGNAKRQGRKVVVITDPGVMTMLYKRLDVQMKKAA